MLLPAHPLGAVLAQPRLPEQQSFGEVVSPLTVLADYAFGTDTPPPGATQIADGTTLAAYFNPYRMTTNPNKFIINTENQRYADDILGYPDNFVFAGDALELTATVDPPPHSTTTTTVSGAVSNSNQVTVASTTDIRVGRVLSFGALQDDNIHRTASFQLRGSLHSGDTMTLTFSCPDPSVTGYFDPITITTTTTGTSTYASLIQALVDGVNANTHLQAAGVTAFKYPSDPNAFAVISPRYPGGSPTPPWGDGAAGSFTWMKVQAAKTGFITFALTQVSFTTIVTAISGSVLTLNHPVTVPDGASVYVQPTLQLLRTDTFAGASTTHNVGDTTGLSVGQLCQLGFSDNNLRRIVSLTSTTVTFAVNVSLPNGTFVTALSAWQALASAAVSASNVLPFAAVPADVRVGMECEAGGAITNPGRYITAIDRVSSPQTVTISDAVTIANNTVVNFLPRMLSAQIWTQTGYMPGELGRDMIAIEWEVDCPPFAALSSWPACWLYKNADDTTGLPQPPNAHVEVDAAESFNYWMSAVNDDYKPGTPSSTNATGNHWFAGNNVGFSGNNFSRATRKIQLLWSQTRQWFFADDLWMLRTDMTYDVSARAQIAANLALGSHATSFNSNGFYPVDWSQFPMAFRVRRMRIWGG